MSGKPSYNISVPALRLSILFSVVLVNARFLFILFLVKSRFGRSSAKRPTSNTSKRSTNYKLDIQTLQFCLKKANNLQAVTSDLNAATHEGKSTSLDLWLLWTKLNLTLWRDWIHFNELTINRFSDNTKLRSDVLDLYLSLTNNYLDIGRQLPFHVQRNHASDLMSEKTSSLSGCLWWSWYTACHGPYRIQFAMLKLKKSALMNEKSTMSSMPSIKSSNNSTYKARKLNEVSINPKQRRSTLISSWSLVNWKTKSVTITTSTNSCMR